MIHLQVRFRYHARRMLQPKIPPTASEFCAMLPTTAFGDYYKFSVTCGNQTAVVFFSDKMNDFLTEVMNIQFDRTFFALPIQFFQLWTLFVAVGRHTLPAIHCLMTAKNQVLYQAILEILGLTFLLFSLSLQCQTRNQQPELHFAMYIRKWKFMVTGFIYSTHLDENTKTWAQSEFQSFSRYGHIYQTTDGYPIFASLMITPTYTFFNFLHLKIMRW